MEKPSSHRIVQKYNCIYTNETISLFSSVNVLRSAYSGTDSITDYSEHRHSFYEIQMAVSGSIDMVIDRTETVHIPMGHYIIVPKKCLHRLSGYGDSGSRLVIAFDIKDEFGQKLIGNPFCRQAGREVMNAVSDLLSEDGLKISGLAQYAAFCRIAVELFIDCTGARLPESSNNTYIRMMQRYLKDNARKVVIISDITEYCCCSQRNINRILKKEMNTNISTVLADHTMGVITHLLQNTDLSLKEIADITGFSTENSLSRFFSQHMKTPPNRFRRVSTGMSKV